MSSTDAGETSSISISVENRLIDLDRSRERRYTLEDQKIDYPADTGFKYINGLQDKSIQWGSGTNPTAGGGGDPSDNDGNTYE